MRLACTESVSAIWEEMQFALNTFIIVCFCKLSKSQSRKYSIIHTCAKKCRGISFAYMGPHIIPRTELCSFFVIVPVFHSGNDCNCVADLSV